VRNNDGYENKFLGEFPVDVITAIHSRHSIGKLRPEKLPRELIEKLLSAAVQAPNHYKVRPWSFVVVTGKGLEKFGDHLAKSFQTKFPDAPLETIEKVSRKPLRAPLIIVVAVNTPTEGKIDLVENISAAAAACQNILLAAVALGLAGIWRTGDAARDPETKRYFGFSPDQHLIGFLYIGYPDHEIDFPERPSFEDRVVWME